MHLLQVCNVFIYVFIVVHFANKYNFCYVNIILKLTKVFFLQHVFVLIDHLVLGPAMFYHVILLYAGLSS